MSAQRGPISDDPEGYDHGHDRQNPPLDHRGAGCESGCAVCGELAVLPNTKELIAANQRLARAHKMIEDLASACVARRRRDQLPRLCLEWKDRIAEGAGSR